MMRYMAAMLKVHPTVPDIFAAIEILKVSLINGWFCYEGVMFCRPEEHKL